MAEKQNAIDKTHKVKCTVAGKAAFSKYVASRELKSDLSTTDHWNCCGNTYLLSKDIHKHVAMNHMAEINTIKEEIMANGDEDIKYAPLKKKARCDTSSTTFIETDNDLMTLAKEFNQDDEFPWLPKKVIDFDDKKDPGQILLFYHYREITNTQHVLAWQRELCQRLNLSGKVRIAQEGLNVTVGGTLQATDTYIDAILNHPLFVDMKREQFKKSLGSSKDFPDGLKVGIYKEAVPMGVEPTLVTTKEAGKHLTPDKFHEAVANFKADGTEKKDSVVIDCRNFYESKIGNFTGAVCPDIRKFSYWPEYVDKNEDVFKDKNVYMYCTGGIRCERGSAYLKSKGICKDVFQLEGGIHKYVEKYPDGYFRGKLFVFDNRYHITANSDVVSGCTYCKDPWDQYQPCTSRHCHQLVLSCDKCRDKQFTACCKTCQKNDQDSTSKREECECTQHRARIPIETEMHERK